MHIPPISSLDNAISTFWLFNEIGNAEIKVIFKKISPATIVKLKQLAKRKMNERGVPSYGLYKVNTRIAYEVWGLDIDDLEARRNKLKALELQ